MTSIQTINLTKKYKGKTVVDSLNLDIAQGELFALLGVNGAGKSTTIKMLSCITKPTEGDALLLGNSIRSNQQKIKEQISVSPQETAVAPNLTVRENLELISGIYGSNRQQARQIAGNTISSFGLSDIAKERAKTLSGGWQRRLSIAMALISEPKILFLDEPTLGLDVLARRDLWSLIQKLKGKVTIILTTHYLEEAESLSDRIGILSKGRLKAIGTAPDLMAETKTSKFEDAFIAIAEEEEMQA